MAHEKLIKLDGTLNTRDIGGYKSFDGRKIKYGKLYRSSELSYLSAKDVERLKELNVTAVVDFRGEEEAKKAPANIPGSITRIHSPIISDKLDISAVHRYLKKHDLPVTMHDEKKVSDHGPLYRMISLVNSYDDPKYVDKLTGYQPFFQQLLKQPEDSAMLFHCTGGRDRTGVATALLMYILGVSEKDIMKSYLASNVHLQPEQDNPDSLAFEKLRFSNIYVQPTSNKKFQLVAQMFGTSADKIKNAIELKPEYLKNLFYNIEHQYGTVEKFFEEKLGIGESEINILRNKFLYIVLKTRL